MQRPGPMQDAFRDHHSLARIQFDGAAFEVDEQAAIGDVEEFVIVVVLVPVIFALDDTEPYYGIVHLAERLVVPLELASFRERLGVDPFERWEKNIQAGFVGKAHATDYTAP